MAEQFRLQDPGEGIHEAEILEVHVAEGDDVSEGDDLFTVETDKAAVVIPSPFDGTVEKVAAKKGASVTVGDVLLAYSTGAESGDGAGSDSASDSEERASSGKGAASGKQADSGKKAKSGKKADSGEKSPPGEKAGSEQQTEAAEKQPRQGAAKESGDDSEDAVPSPNKPASPATRRLARELDVDLDEVTGSGRGGRIESADVERAAGEGASEPDDAETAGADRRETDRGSEPTFDFERWGDIEIVEPRATRRRIAEHMETAWRNVPHVMHADYFDVTKLEELRQKHAGDYREQGGKLTMTVFALKAVALALKDFPRFNASLDPQSGNLVLKRYCHIGVAIDTREGLLVPVIRDVDAKPLADLSCSLVELADKARGGNLQPREMQGGSISLTNPGGLGATFFTPIINYPEVAIVGLGTVRGSAQSPPTQGRAPDRLWLPLMVSFDHRVNDGADAARFVRRIGELLANPEDMLLAA